MLSLLPFFDFMVSKKIKEVIDIRNMPSLIKENEFMDETLIEVSSLTAFLLPNNDSSSSSLFMIYRVLYE